MAEIQRRVERAVARVGEEHAQRLAEEVAGHRQPLARRVAPQLEQALAGADIESLAHRMSSSVGQPPLSACTT
jgi:hypothetical protein